MIDSEPVPEADPYRGLRLDGKVAVVTGAARGIGRATADLLRARGAAVVEVHRTGAEGTDVVRADVGIAADCARLGQELAARHPRIHILVNNAGMGGFDLDLEQADENDWDRLIAVNAKSAFLITKALLPLLKAAQGAAVVNVSSVHAVATSAGVEPYAASKGALVSLTRAMAIDLAPHLIRVVSVLPGATRTDMMQAHVDRLGGTAQDLGFKFEDRDFPRVCEPEETAEAIAFLASPAASAIAGSAVYADGGLLSGLGF